MLEGTSLCQIDKIWIKKFAAQLWNLIKHVKYPCCEKARLSVKDKLLTTWQLDKASKL